MTAPRQRTASTLPAWAKARATRGSSKAPGAQATVMSRRSVPASCRPSSAPSSRRMVTPPLKSAQPMPMRRPVPSCAPRRLVPTREAMSSSAPSGSAATSEPAISAGAASQDVVEAVQQVAHPLPLRAQVGDVLGIGRRLQRHALGDVETEPLEAAVLDRVVGHEAHGGHPEVDQHLGADAVLAAVDRQALLQVGVDGVVALLLQLVGPDLVAEADAAALVAAQVDEHAPALALDHVQGGVQLRPAVAAQRAEALSAAALGVEPHQHVLGARPLAHDEGEVLLIVEDGFVDEGAERAVLG